MKDAYREALTWLYNTQDRGVKLGLDNIRHLLGLMNNPQQRLRFIHVAGTNGKGSVCAMIDSICRAAGLRSGLFTSPHLVRFNERIQVQRVPISNQALTESISRVRQLVAEDFHPTFFEITTAIAFEYFLRRKTEIVVLETGLGGRLDATNLVMPLATVLTSIDLDHQKWLGDTLGQIAAEKAGIIKDRIPVVSPPQLDEVKGVIEEVARQRSTTIEYATQPLPGPSIGLRGPHQRINAAVAVHAVKAAGLPINEEAITHGLLDAFWPGRFQELEAGLILDGAHNPAALNGLVETWREVNGDARPVVVFGGLEDKEIGKMLQTLGQIAHSFFIVPVRSPRAASVSQLENEAKQFAPSETFNSIPEALFQARQSGRMILVTGSLFLVGEVLALLQLGPDSFQESAQ